MKLKKILPITKGKSKEELPLSRNEIAHCTSFDDLIKANKKLLDYAIKESMK